MTSAKRVLLGVSAVILFLLSSAVVLLPVRTADPGMALALLPNGGGLRVVRAVAQGGAAQLAGLRDGDVIDLAAMSIPRRLALQSPRSPSDVIVNVNRAGRTFTAVLHFRSPVAPLTAWAIALTIAMGFVYTVLAFLTLRRAADRIEGRFLVYWILGQLASDTAFAIFAPTGTLSLLGNLMVFAGATWFYYFLSRFILAVPPRESPFARTFSKIVVACTVLMAATGLYEMLNEVFPAAVPAFAAAPPGRLIDFIDICFSLLWLVILIDGFARTQRAGRVQLQWIASTIILSVVLECIRQVSYLFALPLPPATDNVFFAVETTTILGPAYAILRHRLIDLELVVSRVAIFTAVSAAVLIAFLVLEWLGTVIAERVLGVVASAYVRQFSGLAAALIAGVLVRPIHASVERALNTIFFARQRGHEDALRRFAREAEVATDPQALLSAAYRMLHQHAQSTYVAIMVRDGSGYRCVHASRPLREHIPENEPVVLRLRRFTEPFEVDDSDDELLHATLYPVTVLGKVIAFFACGPKPDRTHFSERENEILAGFAQRVGTAYAWLSTDSPSRIIT
ncbi:MAG TPA: hypothetical protein VFH72_00675 [Candidatus Baltobacteraceae bacterium]|nr:hypothetical protein [Candidatus Baltobacteraceae bacterium]